MTYTPLIALVAILAGVWGFGRLMDRRFKQAIAVAVARLNGRYEPGGPFNLGSLYGRLGEREIVISFQRASSSSPEYTYVSAILRRPVKETFVRTGADVVARVPGLQAFSSWAAPLQLRAESTQLTVRMHRVLRNGDRLMEAAGLVAGLADELESKPS